MEEAGGVNIYGFVSNNPFKYIDPFGLEIRIYSANTFGGAGGAQHVFVHSTKTGESVGRSGCSGKAFMGNGAPKDFDAKTSNLPYSVIDTRGSGKTESEIMKEFRDHINDSFIYCPFLSDCHSAIGTCERRLGLPPTKGPVGRSDLDDKIRNAQRPLRVTPPAR